MGLDMYLNAGRYVGDWDHAKPEERSTYKAITAALGISDLRCEGSPHLTVNVCVAYWRKANAIHAWFVRECQDGVDECQDTYVEREKLQELLDLCRKVKETKDATPLPPQAGFFFGSTDIDEWYWSDIDSTIDQLAAILDNPALKGFDFEYHSSW